MTFELRSDHSIKTAVTYGQSPDHPTSFRIYVCAALKGNVKMLDWLYENKHPINFISTAPSILNEDERIT
jgi:hypothetical protein